MRTTRTLLSLIAATFLAAAAFASATWDRAVAVGTATLAYAKRFALHVVDVLAPQPARDRAPAGRFLQARAFLARITRREAVQLTSGWRMCPSV